jgi:hypothetical protein
MRIGHDDVVHVYKRGEKSDFVVIKGVMGKCERRVSMDDENQNTESGKKGGEIEKMNEATDLMMMATGSSW